MSNEIIVPDSSIQRLKAILQAILNQDNSIRVAGEAELSKLKMHGSEELIVGLIQLVSDHNNPQEVRKF